MAYSIQTAVSDGNLEVLDLSIKYMDKSHIFVYVDDVLVDGSAYTYSWLTDTRIQLVPKVANGSTLKVIRKTLTDEMWHEFSEGARFSTASMDENFEQLLFLAQEYSEGIYVSDFYTDIDLHLRRILNLGDPVVDTDAVNLKTLKEYLPNADLLPAVIDRIVAEETKSTQLLNQGIVLATKTVMGFDASNLPDGVWVHLAGRDTIGDGGGGPFRYSASSVEPADGVIVFAPTGGGRLIRSGWSTTIDLAWAGAKGTGLADDTLAINTAAAAAKSRNIRYLTAKPGEYYCAGELVELDNVLIIGTRAKIVSPLANNYYARIYDPAYQPATPLINPQVNKRGLSRFFTALNRYRNGGAAPVVVFVGDSLTQGGHRAFDNWFWVQQFKQKLSEAYGVPFQYYNRGIAGRAAGDVANAVGLADVHAPFESNWVTNPSNTWLSYISALNPDLVVVAFGMNSANANDSVDIVNLRNSLKALTNTPSLVWVTTPIRTTDLTASFSGSRFGTYPGNQYSNNNAYMTRLIADFYGDPVVDVNRMSNIVQLGVDPYDYAIDRWAGLYVDNSKKFTGSIPIVVNPDGTLDLPVGGGNEFITNELFREVFVEFDVPLGTVVNPARVEMRQDPNSASGVVLLFKSTSIELYYTTFTGGNFGLQQTYTTSPTAGNRYRIELVGKRLRLYVINGSGSALLGEVSNILGSTFLAPVRFVGQGTTNATLKNVVIYGASRETYKQYVPRLTSAEVFRVWYGGGGNNLNHPNTRGEMEIYSQPMDEFVSTLKSIDPEGSYTSGTLTLNAGITSGLATYRVVDGKYVTISFVDLQVTSTLGANNLLTAVPAGIRPSETVYGTLWTLYGSTIVGFDIRLNGNSYLGGDLVVGATYKGTISYVI